MTKMPNLSHEELRLQAFRYSTGEMTSNENSTFEQLLDSSQEAREAVAFAVTLQDALLAERAPSAVAHGPSRWRPLVAAVVVLGITMFAVERILVEEEMSETTSSDAVGWLAGEDVDELMTVWAQLQPEEGEESLDPDMTASEAAVEDGIALPEEVGEQADPPDWAIMAVEQPWR